MPRIIKKQTSSRIDRGGVVRRAKILEWTESDSMLGDTPGISVRATFELVQNLAPRVLWFFSYDNIWQLERWYQAAGVPHKNTPDGTLWENEKMVGSAVNVFAYENERGFIDVAKFPAQEMTREQFVEKFKNWAKRHGVIAEEPPVVKKETPQVTNYNQNEDEVPF